MKNTGLMTCYVDNYGACLQAYALQSAIEKAGNSCRIIQYTPYVDLRRLTNFVEKPESLELRITRAIRHPIQLVKRKRFSKKSHLRDSRFSAFRNCYLKFDEHLYSSWDELKTNVPQYDNFVCGSDQIWNPVIHGNHNVGPYFLDFVPEGKKRIAYAPSIGIQVVPDECKSQMSEFLCTFDTLSVREKRGAELIKEITGLDAPVVLDPTLLFDGNWWSQVCSPVEIKKPYILCYLFNEHESTYNFVEQVRKNTGLDVITLPFALRDIYGKSKKIYDAGPAEFIWLIKNAEMIITDSFHATAFSINFNKSFYCLRRNTNGEVNNMNSRIVSILSMAGIQNRLLDETENGFVLPDSKIDYNEVNKRISEKRECNFAFLKEAIEVEDENA